MRGKSRIAAIVGLLALVISPMAAMASAPIALELPDIRNAVNSGGSQSAVLDLDEYVIDQDSRVQATSAQQDLTWIENGSRTAVIAGNELQVTVPTGTAPVTENVTLTVSDGPGSDTSAIRVHTADALLGGPLVDTQIAAGSGSTIPYFWCVESGQTGTLEIPFAGAASRLKVTTGFTQSCLIAANSWLDTAEQANPLMPLQPGVTTVGTDTTAPLALANVGNLSIDANVNGLQILPLTGFSQWVRVTVTRESNGGDDSYSVAIGDYLNGVNTSLSGLGSGDSEISTVNENYKFENVTTDQFLGMASSSAYNLASNAERQAAVNNNPGGAVTGQKTNWNVYAKTQAANGAVVAGNSLCGLEVTSAGKPAPTYPGATDGNALKLTIGSGKNGVFMQHKGIPPSQYDPGDVITLSVNTYFDLGYNGTATDGIINEPTSSIAVALVLNTLPGALCQNLNYVSFPVTAAAVAPLRKGATGFGRGGGQMINPLAIVDKKWTRHEVSMRVPDFGQNIDGPVGDGNVADSVGIGAQIYIARIDAAPAGLPDQVVWMDNICITRCPSALAIANGATIVPMVSSGFSFQFNNGLDSGPNAAVINPNFYGDIPMPTALARGQVIFGSISQGGTGSAQPVTGRVPATVFGASPGAHTDSVNNAKAGVLEPIDNTDLAIVGTGAADVALNFPILNDGNRALVLGPVGVTGNAFTAPITTGVAATGHPGKVAAEISYVDMRLASDVTLPGLRVADVVFNGGADANLNNLTGNMNPDRIPGNVSGVFGVRWFVRSNADNISQNPMLTANILNADQTLGLSALRKASVLPADDNIGIPDDVWGDDFISGSVITFNAYGKQYDLLCNNQTGGRFAGQTPAATLNGLKADNPGAQLASIFVRRGNSYSAAQTVNTAITTAQNGFDGIYNTGNTPPAQPDLLPGRYSTAVLSIDEINLLSVRDVAQFYDEALQ